MYINNTSIPPITVMNRMYENQNLLYIVPLNKHTVVVWISSISPMARGSFICANMSLVIVLIDTSNFVISGGILFKMLVLGINEIVLLYVHVFYYSHNNNKKTITSLNFTKGSPL
jgi:hypothetical protein